MGRRHRFHRRHRPDPVTGIAYQASSVRWSLRLLAGFVEPRALPEFVSNLNEATVATLRLPSYLQRDSGSELRACMRAALARVDRRRERLAEPLATNLANLGQALDLKPIERRLLAFMVLAHTNRLLADVTETLTDELDSASTARLLAVALAEPLADVERALRTDSALARSGLLRLDHDGTYSLRNKVDLLTGLPDALLGAPVGPMELLSRYFAEADAPTLAREDFPHAADDLALLLPYLEHSAAVQARGVNILVHGRPGTGKTELARLLARLVGYTLYEVSVNSPER